MSSHDKHEIDPQPRFIFENTFRDLLPGVEFEEPTELSEARKVILEALARKDQSLDTIHLFWIEYARIGERFVDSNTEANSKDRAQLQIALLVHKALIFRGAEDMQRYSEELRDAREYAYNIRLDRIVEAIDAELDTFTT